jgi:hypothetical protein
MKRYDSNFLAALILLSEHSVRAALSRNNKAMPLKNLYGLLAAYWHTAK